MTDKNDEKGMEPGGIEHGHGGEPAWDTNVEKLLQQAWRPEPVDPAFARRVEDAMLVAGARRAGRGRVGARTMLLTAAAALVAFGIGLRAGGVWGVGEVDRGGPTGQGSVSQGQAGQGQAGQGQAGEGEVNQGRVNQGQVAGGPVANPEKTPPNPVPDIPAPIAPAPVEDEPRVAPAVVLATGAGERRRMALKDGSVVYLNERTEVRVVRERTIWLAKGELFVEVAHREDERFVVRTESGDVTALGTRFGVRRTVAARRSEVTTDVLVTQGLVAVGGDGQRPARQVRSGEQVRLDADAAPEPAPRASHRLAWMRDLVAAARTPLVPASKHRGGALVAVDPNGQEMRLSLRKLHVDVHIEDGFARTTLDQTYFNHATWRLEGTFYFPLPADASLSRLAMYVNGQLMEGGMAERGHARNVFEEIRHTRRDPALLEWVDGSTFKMRVFPLEPRQEKRIVISYTQRLGAEYGETRYRVPSGHSLGTVREWSFKARLRGGAGAAWDCSTHPLQAVTSGGDLILTTEAKGIVPDRDVAVTLHRPRPEGEESDVGAASFATVVHEGQRYLMVRHRPELDAEPRHAPRDWVFVFESTGDRDPLLAGAQVEVIKTLLENAERHDRFTVLAAGTRATALNGGLQPCTRENIAEVLDALESVHLVGALDLGVVLGATAAHVEASRETFLVHVGSGVPVLGEREVSGLLERLPDGARYVGVGVGKRWNRSFMRAAAARSGGHFDRINPDENVAWRAFELRAALLSPRLLDVTVENVAGGAPFLTWSDTVLQGQELAAVVRLEKGAWPEQIAVRGTLLGEPYRRELAVPARTALKADAGVLPRTWGKLEIDRLVAEGAEQNRAAVVALSKAMYVMSPFTSLLVLETEAMYKQYGVDRGRKDHWALYPCPEVIPVVREPLRGGQVVREGKATPDEAAREAVLKTILVRMPPRMFDRDPVYYVPSVTAWQLATLDPIAFSTPVVTTTAVDEFFLGRENTWNSAIGLGGGAGGGRAARRDLHLSFRGSRAFDVGRRDTTRGFFERSALRRLGEMTSNRDAPNLIGNGAIPLTSGRASLAGRWGVTAEGGAIDLPRFRTWSAGNFGWVSPFGGAPQIGNTISLFGEVDFLGVPSRLGQMGYVRDFDVEAAQGARILDNAFLPPSSRYEAQLGFVVENPAALATAGYARPGFAGDLRVFTDLLAHAPGMNTAIADIDATIDREVPDAAVVRGSVQPEARALIVAARSRGWQRIAIPAGAGGSGFELTFDGAGRHRYERVTAAGLREQVVCDGETLWHLYPELGVGARRRTGRSHRVAFGELVPWSLPPVDDLARDADLVMVDDATVAIRPRTLSEGGEHVRVELVFAAARLVERRFVEMPARRVVRRETYDADGRVRRFAGGDATAPDGDRVTELRAAKAPDLQPPLADLVVLPMPLRTGQHVLKVSGNPKVAYRDMSEETALAFIGASLGGQGQAILYATAERFVAQGDRRLGFLTLALAGGARWERGMSFPSPGGARALEPLELGPASPLARYLDVHRLPSANAADLAAIGNGAGFLAQLTDLRRVHLTWIADVAKELPDTDFEQVLAAAARAPGAEVAWSMLVTVQKHARTDARRAALAAAFGRLETDPALGYGARYERARLIDRLGDREQARVLFGALFDDALAAGTLPRFDDAMKQALTDAPGDAGWNARLRDAVALFEREGRLASFLILAMQCHQIGDNTAFEVVMSRGLAAARRQDDVRLQWAAVRLLVQTGRSSSVSDDHVDALLAAEDLATDPVAHRIAAGLAQQQNRLPRAIALLERALDLEHAALPDLVDLQHVRQHHGELLAKYEELARAALALGATPPADLAARVVRTADRWRALDRDVTAACLAASRILALLGVDDLSRDYLTTPMALRPNEAAPWLAMARAQIAAGDRAGADHSFAAAFDAERTNPQILMERAANLREIGRTEHARAVLREIADGAWQPRFRAIQERARKQLGGR